MSLTIQTEETIAVDIPRGGRVRWNGGTEIPETFGRTETGTLLGPLELGVPPGGTLTVDALTFGPGESDDGWILAAAAAAPIAATSRDESFTEHSKTTRRGVLAFLAAIGLSATAMGSAGAQEDETVTLRVATLTVDSINEPWTIRIMDLVDNVLPQTTEVLIDQDGTRVGSIADADERADLRPETGEVKIYVRDSLGRLAQILAWVQSFVPSDTSITFQRTFPENKLASDYDPDQFITLTEHPAIVDPVRESGPDATRLAINSTQIPHIDSDGSNEAGAWDTVGESIVYDVGENPPAASEWEIQTKPSFIQQLRQ